jgi:hypothetical protein
VGEVVGLGVGEGRVPPNTKSPNSPDGTVPPVGRLTDCGAAVPAGILPAK